MPYLDISGIEFKEITFTFEISTLEFVKNEFLANTGNFGTWSAFSNGPWSAFSQGPVPGMGPLYKLCLKV